MRRRVRADLREKLPALNQLDQLLMVSALEGGRGGRRRRRWRWGGLTADGECSGREGQVKGRRGEAGAVDQSNGQANERASRRIAKKNRHAGCAMELGPLYSVEAHTRQEPLSV